MEALKAIAREALETFEAISNAARRSLGERGITLNALASINEMTASNVAAEMRQMNDQRQSDCVKLRREPAIARLIIADDDDNRQTLYISSGGTVGSPPVPFCSYMSPKGQLARSSCPVDSETSKFWRRSASSRSKPKAAGTRSLPSIFVKGWYP